MKRTIQAIIISALLMGAYAQATPMELSPGDAIYNGATCSDCGPGMSDILAYLNENVEGYDSLFELYKSDEDGDAIGDDSGEFAGDYTTEFMDIIGDPSAATISLDLGSDGIWSAEWLFVKDGKNDPMWYLFDITDWDGMMDIVLTGFWLGNGAISNVSIVGVPEPGTLALLAIGLAGAAFSRRKKAA